MARIDTQNIPAELLELYKAILIPFYITNGSSIVRKRCAFRIPHLQDLPAYIYPRKHGGPSANQKVVREIFRRCVSCFNKQPLTGGVTPPDIGLRNRSWWYTASGGSGLFYYDYFMQQTLDEYFAGNRIDWCHKVVDKDNYVSELAPDTNYGHGYFLSVGRWDEGENIIYLKNPMEIAGEVYLFLTAYYNWETPNTPFMLETYEITAYFPEYSSTWNNPATLGAKIETKLLPKTAYAWASFYMPATYGLAIKKVGLGLGSASFRSRQYYQTIQRPYWSA